LKVFAAEDKDGKEVPSYQDQKTSVLERALVEMKAQSDALQRQAEQVTTQTYMRILCYCTHMLYSYVLHI
jgi:hypothetical protein